MKGIVKFKIDGKKRTLSFGLNTLLAVSEELDIKLDELEKAMGSPKNLRTLIYYAGKYGNEYERYRGKKPGIEMTETVAGFWVSDLMYSPEKFEKFNKAVVDAMPNQKDIKKAQTSKKKGKKKKKKK